MQIELKLLQSQLGITFIFVTHDQQEAMGMSDRIAVMLDGHIEQLADPETVYEHPASAFVAGFIGRNNFWRGVSTGSGVRANDGTVFVSTTPEEQVAQGVQALAAIRPECIKLSAADPGLGVNVIHGTVAGVSHYGDVLQYVVRTAERDVLCMLPRQGAVRLVPGDAVWCQWASSDVYQFSADQADLVMVEPAEDATQ
jgi:ABC-type Fe3+/spermidine/putrescine transport system ATPase subunit